jgi:predicted GNAT family acetyltransferase
MNAHEQCSHGDASRVEAPGASVAHDASSRRFEVRVGDHPLAFLSYSFNGNRVIFEHTFVPTELSGKGVAANLVGTALEEARQRGWRVVPRCSYVAAFIKRNPQFADLIAPEARL